MKKRSNKVPTPNLSIEYGAADIFIFINGVKIAKRGHPNTPHASTWVSLQPGWRVFDDPQGGLVVECDAETIIH